MCLLGKTLWQFLEKLNMQLLHDPEIPLLDIHPKKRKQGLEQILAHTHIHASIIHSSQKVEVTQVSVNRWMDKENGVYTPNGILISFKREGNSDTCYNMDEP